MRNAKAEVYKTNGWKQGKLRSQATHRRLYEERINNYLKDPTLCRQCNTAFDYKSRKKEFCNHSCSATYNNTLRRTITYWNCVNCNKKHESRRYRSGGKYCNHTCFGAHKRKERIRQWVEEGKTDNADIDPFSNTDPGTVINWIKGDYGRDKLGL